MTDGEQQGRPLAGSAWGVLAHLGYGGGDGVELGALLRIVAIFDIAGQ
jgi:hypothetical protein